ncbi:MAG: hypothetical protein M1833_005001 [Piccolia ochrophora]|nr:MAG: hypothetical protein M1833_005001 [Piccolia ochrophora]
MALRIQRREGYDWGSINLDAVGKIYIAFCVIWTVILFAGVAVLLRYRHLDFIRMRNITLVISSLLMIHVYLVLDLLAYPLNGTFPCNLEFWLMSIYFPLGVALYQAHNVQLLNVSGLQKQLIYHPLKRHVRSSKGKKWNRAEIREWWSCLDLIHRTYLVIAIGVTLQLALCIIVFLVSRKFHSFGITSATGDARQCRQGWEWIPTASWQFIWTFGFGPYILFKIRNIKDVHRWTLQTTLAVSFSLPGTPLWLAAIYGRGFEKVNLYWPAPMWFAPGLVMMEFVSVFFPLLELGHFMASRRNVRSPIVDSWPKRSGDVVSISTTSCEKTKATVRGEPVSRSDMYNMHALDHALSSNAMELLQFAATREFTGENIVFLTQIRDWRRSWKRVASSGTVDTVAKRRLYNNAASIFDTSVCLQTAQFPVNIEHKIYLALEQMFRLAKTPIEREHVTPFADELMPGTWSLPSPSTTAPSSYGFPAQRDESSSFPVESLLEVPAGFDEHVFDRAEASVKYMVFTNTWVRFVDEWEMSHRPSTESAGSSRSSNSLVQRLP